MSGNLLECLRNGLATGSFDECALAVSLDADCSFCKKLFGLWTTNSGIISSRVGGLWFLEGFLQWSQTAHY